MRPGLLLALLAGGCFDVESLQSGRAPDDLAAVTDATVPDATSTEDAADLAPAPPDLADLAMPDTTVPTCKDNVQNGNETDVDCGGPDCPPCQPGRKCNMDKDCVTTVCFNGTCVQKVDGLPCMNDVECVHDHCVDGVCCDTPAAQCSGCRACNLAKPGTCMNVPANQDPHAVCKANMANCTQDKCNGNGSCALPEGTSCGAASCAQGVATTKKCDAMGACQTAMAPCKPYQCDAKAASCLAACKVDADCAAGYLCDGAGACVTRLYGTSPVAYAVKKGPVALATGDWNGDKTTDLLVGNNADGSVTVLLGAAKGTFPTAVTTAVGPDVTDVAAGEFDATNDGKLDAVVTQGNQNALAVLTGDGTGKFTVTDTISLGAGTGPVAVKVGHFVDASARPDLVVACSGTDEVAILLGQMTGGFGMPTPYALGSSPIGVAIGAFKGAAPHDVATAASAEDAVAYRFGDGKGNLQPGPAHKAAVGSGPSDIATADLNNDGRADLVTTNQTASTVSVLLGAMMAGNFGKPWSAPTGLHPSALVIADLDGDGKPDLAVTNVDANTVSVLLGKGDGTFQARQDYPTGKAPQAIVAADFNGDGKMDLAVANTSSNNVTVLLHL